MVVLCLYVYACSKGGTDVIVYASKYDGDPLRVVNVCGRFDLVSGINERFGQDIHRRLKEETAIQMRHPNGGPDWTLTEEVWEIGSLISTDVYYIASI